jgi:hypothetical protein
MNFKSAALAIALILAPSFAMGASFVNSVVGVCDPATPANCLKPNADGSLAIAPAGGTETVQGSGTAGAPAGGILTVQGSGGGTPLNVATHAVTQSGAWNVGASGYSFMRVSTTGNTTLKSGTGLFHALCIGTIPTTTESVILYDNAAASGTIIAVFVFGAASQQGCYSYDAIFSTGLTAAISGSATGDFTFTWR